MAALLRVDTADGHRDLGREDLAGLGDEFAFSALAALVAVPGGATHATFHAADGYAASLPIEQAMADARLVVPPQSEGKTGLRLIVAEGTTTCLNVKAVTRVEITEGPGRHTVDPNPHTPARVKGWDR